MININSERISESETYSGQFEDDGQTYHFTITHLTNHIDYYTSKFIEWKDNLPPKLLGVKDAIEWQIGQEFEKWIL